MSRLSGGSQRAVVSAVALCLAAGGLAACGGSEQITTSAPTVTPAGRHYHFSAASVPRSQWPDACDLLTLASAEAAIGSQVSTKRFHAQCIYQPDSATFPTLTISLMALGTDAGSAYRAARSRNHALHPRSVYGVGEAANQHGVPHLPATELEVDAGDAYFTVTSQSPSTEGPSSTQTHSLLVVIGRAVAHEFTG